MGQRNEKEDVDDADRGRGEYPKRPKVDKVLANLADDFSHDSIHALADAEEDDNDKLEGDHWGSEDETAVAADDE